MTKKKTNKTVKKVEDDPRDRPWEWDDKRAGWGAHVEKHMVGATILDIHYMSEADTEESGWYSSPVIFRMQKPNGDIFFMFPMSDDEGNNGGAMATTLPEIDTVPVI